METLKVGIIGAGWMGHVHARAYQRLAQHWPDLAVRPELVSVADSSAPAAAAFARAHGGTTYADWRELLADPDIAAVSVTAPNFLHREIGVPFVTTRRPGSEEGEAVRHLLASLRPGVTVETGPLPFDQVHQLFTSAATALRLDATGALDPAFGADQAHPGVVVAPLSEDDASLAFARGRDDRLLMVSGLVLMGIFMIVPLFFTSAAALFVSRFLAGGATGMYDPAARGLIVDRTPEEKRGEAFGLYTAFQMGQKALAL